MGCIRSSNDRRQRRVKRRRRRRPAVSSKIILGNEKKQQRMLCCILIVPIVLGVISVAASGVFAFVPSSDNLRVPCTAYDLHRETIPWDTSAASCARRRHRSAPKLKLAAGTSGDSQDDNSSASSNDASKYNGDISDDTRGATLTPYQILHPDTFPFMTHEKSSGDSPDGSGITMSLNSALVLLEKTLGRIFDDARQFNQAQSGDDVAKIIVGSAIGRLLGQYADTLEGNNAGGPIVIRIEQILSHQVDPLRWLHANSKKRINDASSGKTGGGDPVVYFADADEIQEAACVGSGLTLNDLVFGDIGEEHDETAWSDWDAVSTLPPRAELYGGSRFDSYEENGGKKKQRLGEEWDAFGNEMWILPSVELRSSPTDETTTLSVHLAFHPGMDASLALQKSAGEALDVLNSLSDGVSPPMAPTDLPPVVLRDYNVGGEGGDGQEAFERGVTAALKAFEDDGYSSDGDECDSEEQNSCIDLQKVVLARRADLHVGSEVSGLDLLMALKFGGHKGHLLYLRPSGNGAGEGKRVGEFFGCSPERLFRLSTSSDDPDSRIVQTEALAGTRPRGSTPQADRQLLQDLITSEKDRSENVITGDFIEEVFEDMTSIGLLKAKDEDSYGNTSDRAGLTESSGKQKVFGTIQRKEENMFFVRRLRQLQHICRLFEGRLADGANSSDAVCHLLQNLHPTPALNGYPSAAALDFIRRYESPSFDRGYYGGPFGYVGRHEADVSVAIRSALLTACGANDSRDNTAGATLGQGTRVSIYAGAGIVPGSTVESEWAETSQKLGVLSSLFPSSPITLQDSPTPNVAWATAFVEELVRSGVTHFYICPGSRSTPLTTALAKATRSRVGTVHAISVHDERGAAFRALGYGRRTGRPAAVVTSSGTAVANLYPAVMEAGMDGVPMLVLTADRPYENRDTGANQAVDQVKAFSSSYTRWFRDILPPSDDVPISVVLSDANHAVTTSRHLQGPVHLNIQFRENLAPDAGAIRNDGRVGSITAFNSGRFTDAPAFRRWSVGGGQWSSSYYSSNMLPGSADNAAVADVAALMQGSKRGIIVVGNIRNNDISFVGDSSSYVADVISDFAQHAGYPIFAGIQGGSLRNSCPAVVPYGEHVLKHPAVAQGVKADFVLQIGAPLISSEIGKIVSECVAGGGSHVLVHPHHPSERADPGFTVTHRVSSEAGSFLKAVQGHLEKIGLTKGALTSDLASIILLGRALGERIPGIIHQASSHVTQGSSEDVVLTEPQIALAISEVLQESSGDTQSALFLSNSMPVRDAEFFLYPHSKKPSGPSSVAVNRGASGIDGIISSAAGYADSSDSPTTLVVGDLASLHDLNAFHTLARSPAPLQQPHSSSPSSHSPPLTTVVVNNDGGGIFSFLPIAKHGNDVGFEEYFGTPTSSFSFSKAADAFGLPYRCASSFEEFKKAYGKAIGNGAPSIVEAQVVGRETNVAVHAEITRLTKQTIDEFLQGDDDAASVRTKSTRLPIKVYQEDDIVEVASTSKAGRKTLLLLHGWMGDKTEWDDTASLLSEELSGEWNIVAIDLPGHGEAPLLLSDSHHAVRTALGIDTDGQGIDLSVDGLAKAVLTSLRRDHGIEEIDAICGYSLGGRVAMAMKRAFQRGNPSTMSRVTDHTRLMLISAYPGTLPALSTEEESSVRTYSDDRLAHKMMSLWTSSQVTAPSSSSSFLTTWSDFLAKWYGAPLWGGMRERRYKQYSDMISKRAASLAARSPDLAIVLRACSPPRNSENDWNTAKPSRKLFMAGELDIKYSEIGRQWQKQSPGLNFIQILNSGHALLIDAPEEVAKTLAAFITKPVETLTDEEALVTPSATVTEQELSQKDVVEEETLGEVIEPLPLPKIPIELREVEYEAFSIELQSNDGKSKGAFGIGWGDRAKPKADGRLDDRRGLIINLMSCDSNLVGIGEVSPLKGLHQETVEEAETLLNLLKKRLAASPRDSLPVIDAEKVLALNGTLSSYVDSLFGSLGLSSQGEQTSLATSVRSGLEMAILSLASQACKTPLPQALATYSPGTPESPAVSPSKLLPLNGIVTRGESVGAFRSVIRRGRRSEGDSDVSYPSMKVKVGHRSAKEDAQSLIQSLSTVSSFSIDDSTGKRAGGVRADANRAWDEDGALDFAAALERLDPDVIDRIEFIEEPLQSLRSFSKQVMALEQLYKRTGIRYALDESIADLAEEHDFNFDAISVGIRDAFVDQGRAYGCSAFVLKPALLGMELSMRLARMSHNELGIGAVFSSSFDSGVGLAYASFLASVSDGLASANTLNKYPHGLGTFGMLNGDTLSPPFKSYVKQDGTLQVATLGRALYGLGLEDMREFFTAEEPQEDVVNEELEAEKAKAEEPIQEKSILPEKYQATASTSSTGREISVQVSLPLPFSDDIACARFSDLPQQSRWSPWLNSVAYLEAGGETEWTLNVRGVQYRWRAVSKILDNPRGIMWESVSGLKNKGVVEFIPTSDAEDAADAGCLMKVNMTIVTPRVLASVFRGTSAFVEEFLQNKLLKWSLESFRDVVKADLALERGDVELGDALFGAVEGKMNAIEATLSYPVNKSADDSGSSDEDS